MEQMEITIKEVKEVIKKQLEQNEKNRVIICLEGEQGIGKTEAIKQVAQENNWKYKALYGAQTQVEDLMGMPIKQESNKITEFSKPNLFPDEERTIFVLEEVNRSQLDVQQAILQLLTEKKFANHELPKDTMIVISMNPSDINSPYNVDELDPVFYNRICKIKVKANINEWLEYATEKEFNKYVINYLKFFGIIDPDKYFSKKPTRQNIYEALPSPRTWELASRILNMYTDNDIKNNSLLKKMLCGVIGYEVSKDLIDNIDFIKDANFVFGKDIIDNYNDEKIRQKFITQLQNHGMTTVIINDLSREINYRRDISEQNITNIVDALRDTQNREHQNTLIENINNSDLQIKIEQQLFQN